jgi:hypothetical protein
VRVLVRPSVPDDALAIAAIQVRSFQVGLADVHPAEALATLDPAPRIPLGLLEALLWVHADNRRARRFYEAGGWRLDGAEKEQEPFGRPVKAVLYRILLR